MFRIIQQASLVGSIIFFCIFSASQTALSACSPTPTTGPDTINCTGPSANAALSTLAGSDVINYNSGAGSTIDAGADNDTINLNGGTLSGGVNGGNGADTFNLNGTAVTGNLDGGSGDAAIDKFFLNSGSAANVSGQGGNDEIYLQGATIGNSTAGIINAGDGNDIITVTSGTVFGIQGWLGSDTITVSGASTIVHAYVNGTWGNDFYYLNGGTINRIEEFDGDDYIELNGATIQSFIVGLSGSDVIKLKSGSVGGNVHGDDGDDTIDLEGASVTGTIFGANNSDTINLKGGSAGGVDGGAGIDFITQTGGSVVSIVGGTENDEIRLNGGNVTSTGNAVRGGDGNDLLELNGSTVAGAIQGEGGSDTINLKSGSAGNVDGGAGIDFITQTGGSVLSIAGGTENDEIRLNGGNVTSTGNAVTGGDGNDLLELNGSTIAGAIHGEGGSDTINLKSGSAGNVDGGAGIDLITQTGGSVVSIVGGAENDEIRLNGGNVTSTGNAVMGGDGDDLIDLNGSTIAGAINGDGGDDLITWSSGRMLAIDGGEGSDQVLVTAGDFDGSQLLDGGDDFSAADGSFDTLTIRSRNFSASGDTLVNWEKLVLDNSTMTLAGGNFFVGDASDSAAGLFLINGAHFSVGTNGAIAAARLFASNQAALSSLFISAGSVFVGGGGGINAVSGKVTNFGTIDLQDDVAGDVFSVGGDYAGGGQILLDVNAAAALSDRMEIGGNVVGGPTRILISETSGLEGSGLPITVVTVAGQTRPGDFTSKSFKSGAYSYSLELDGQDWAFQPTITAAGNFFPTVAVLLSGFARESIGSYYRRNGSWSQARATGGTQLFAATSVLAEPETGFQGDSDFWFRGIGAWMDGTGELSGGAGDTVNYDRDSKGLQGGIDMVIAETADHLFTAGLFAQYGKISGSARDAATGASTGSADTTALGLGGSISVSSATGYGEVAAGWNDYGVDTILSDGATGETDGQGYAISIEGGRIAWVSGWLAIVPQAQLAWFGNRIEGFETSDGTNVEYDAEHAAEGRIGLGLEADAGMLAGQPLALTGILNLRQQFGDPSLTFISGQPLSLEQSGGSLEAGMGFSWGRNRSAFQLYGEGAYREAVHGDGESGWNATGGFRLSF